MFLFHRHTKSRKFTVETPLLKSEHYSNNDEVKLRKIKNRVDVERAAKVLADAFRGDEQMDKPMDEHMKWIFGSKENYDRCSERVFRSWVWYGVLYGHVYTTENFECVAMLKEPGHFGFSVWGMLRSGMVFSALWNLGFSGCKRLSQYDKLATEYAKKCNGTDNFWYYWQVGVNPDCQRQGWGKKVTLKLEEKIRKKSHNKEPIVYLEAVSALSVTLFSHRELNYKTVDTYDLPYSVPVTCMRKKLQPIRHQM